MTETQDRGVLAEEVLKALQRTRPSVEPIPPLSWIKQGGRPEKSPLLPEGTRIISRAGHIEQEGSWWRLVPESGDEPSMKLLPNTTLEALVRTVQASPDRINVVVSGETTVFGTENYLLARSAVRKTVADRQAQATQEKTKPGQDTAGSGSPDAELIETYRTPARIPTDSDADKVVALLKSQEPAEFLVAPEAAPRSSAGQPSLPPRSAASAPLAPLLDGTALVGHVGRLLRQGNGWALIQESDQVENRFPILRLLPNQSLEMMVKRMEEDASGLVFTASGEVTAFEGQNYLLIRSAVHRVVSDQFGK